MRRTGRTTRLVNNAIENLFINETISVSDHHGHGQNIQANDMLMNKIITRMNIEHPHVEHEKTRVGNYWKLQVIR